jgi:hypothetical protein
MTMKNSVWREVRFSLYLAAVLNGLIIQVVPFQYKCNFTDEKCFACGLRTAVDLFLHGRFLAAYQSNRLIVVLALAAAIMAVDVLLYLYRQGQGKRHGPV